VPAEQATVIGEHELRAPREVVALRGTGQVHGAQPACPWEPGL